jgi:hypothetical protein
MNNENINYDEYDIEKQPIFDDLVNKDESVRKNVRPTTEEINELFEGILPPARRRLYNYHLNLFLDFIDRLLELIEPKKQKITPKDDDEYKLKLIIMTGQFLKPYLDSKHKKYLAEELLPFLGELRHYKALLTVNNPPYIKLMRELEQHFDLNDLEEFNLDKREKLGSDLELVELPPPPEDSNLSGNGNSINGNSINGNSINGNSNESLGAEGRIGAKKIKRKVQLNMETLKELVTVVTVVTVVRRKEKEKENLKIVENNF